MWRRRASVSVKEEFGGDTTEWVMSVPCGVANTAVWMEGESACDNRSCNGFVCSITRSNPERSFAIPVRSID